MQAYSQPSQELEPTSLPDVEVFCVPLDYNPETEDGEPLSPGWYWWSCFPGCLPDSDPVGPFDSEGEALADCQEGE